MESSRLKRSIRICETCKQQFEVRNCYLTRQYRNGRFCSNECRNIGFRGAGNPKASCYAAYGSKVSQNLRQLERYQKLRKEVLERIAQVRGVPLCCGQCGCDHYQILQANHLVDFKSKQSGVALWRHILKISDEELRGKFDIRCELCNWHFHLQQKHPDLVFTVEWKGRK